MFYTFIVILAIIAVCVGLLSVRLFAGKPFVHTHIDGNAALNSRGIHCARETDRQERRPRRTAVKERSK